MKLHTFVGPSVIVFWHVIHFATKILLIRDSIFVIFNFTNLLFDAFPVILIGVSSMIHLS